MYLYYCIMYFIFIRIKIANTKSFYTILLNSENVSVTCCLDSYHNSLIRVDASETRLDTTKIHQMMKLTRQRSTCWKQRISKIGDDRVVKWAIINYPVRKTNQDRCRKNTGHPHSKRHGTITG